MYEKLEICQLEIMSRRYEYVAIERQAGSRSPKVGEVFY